MGVPLVVTVNASLPTPVRPSMLITFTSKPEVTASDAMVMFAVRLVEPLKVVELTVTPPGLVVPPTNHCALAPLLKPLPFTVTFRFVVPWGAASGLVEFTWICAVAKIVLTNSQTHNSPQHRSKWFVTVFLSRKTCFVPTTRTPSQFFREFFSLHLPHKDKRRPEIRMAVAAAAQPHGPLGLCQRRCRSLFRQAAIEIHHQLQGGAVVDRPQAGEHGLATRRQEGARKANEIVTRRNLAEIPAAQRGLAGAQRYQVGMEFEIKNLMHLQKTIVFAVRLQLQSREQRRIAVQVTVRRQVKELVVSGHALERILRGAFAGEKQRSRTK